jgi:hypothetical protein
LRVDPALRTVVGGRARDLTAASTSEIGRFETEALTTRENLNRLMDLSGQWIDRAHRHRKLTRIGHPVVNGQEKTLSGCCGSEPAELARLASTASQSTFRPETQGFGEVSRT